ncbi:hypothetical protein GCM10027430_26850 [Lysobacter tyrosinilyticus]
MATADKVAPNIKDIPSANVRPTATNIARATPSRMPGRRAWPQTTHATVPSQATNSATIRKGNALGARDIAAAVAGAAKNQHRQAIQNLARGDADALSDTSNAPGAR